MKKFSGKALRSLAIAGVAALAVAAGAQAQSANAVSAQAGPRARITQAINDTQLATLHGNVHPLARAEFDRGEVDFSRPVTRMLLLLQRSAEQEAALAKLMEEQQAPSSPNFHKWLTPAEFGTRFGPADADIQKIKDWLGEQGFTGIKVSAGKTVVQFDGTAGQVAAAFHTSLHHYFVNGKDHFANATSPQIPAALSPVVAGVVSLHSFRKKSFANRAGSFRRNAATGEITPLFTFNDVNGTFFAIGPQDFATIYNVPAGADGTNQSIAIVARSNINIQDVRDFRAAFGLAAKDPQIILNGPDPGLVSGDETEADLDVEWAGAVAPAATIKFVTTEATFTDATDGVDASALYIVDNGVAPILSDSYGACERGLGNGGNAFYNALWQQAAAEGISVSVAAGDNGSAGCDDPNSASSATGGLAVSGLASTPFNVAMGGTDFDYSLGTATYWNSPTPPSMSLANSAKSYIPELPWNDSCAAAGLTGCNTVTSSSPSLNIVAASGGVSACVTSTNTACVSGYAKPSWQQGGITPNDNARDLPDASLFSGDGLNGTFYVVCQSDQDIPGDTGCSLTKFTTTTPFHDFQGVGGTSAAAPAFAGIMALVNQRLGGAAQGNPNPVLYKLLSTAGVFHDVTSGNISVPCPGGTTTPNCSKNTAGGFGVLTTAAGGTTVAYTAGTGYDLATGLGSVDVTQLLNNWGTVSLGLTGTTTSLTGPTPSTLTVGANVTVSGSVTKASGTTTPSGVVVLENAATRAPIDSFTLDPSGNYSATTAFLPAGNYSVIAHYGGDTTFASSDSAATPVTVSTQNSTVIVSFVGATGAISTAAQTVQYGSPYILRIDVANASGTPCQNGSGAVTFLCPTGTVTLLDKSLPLNDFPNLQGTTPNVAPLNDRGFAEDQPIQLAAGTHSITASYTADANSSYNSQSASNTLSVTITQATTTTTVTSSAPSVVRGGTVTLTATVSSNSNSAQGPSGTVQFLSNGANLGSAATCTPAGATSSAGASCTATLTTALSALPPEFFGPAEPRAPRVPLTWLAAALMLLCLMLAWRFRGKRRAMAYAGVVLLAAAAFTASLAGCSGPGGSSAHTASITAKYSGDTNYATSTSAATPVTIQ